MSRYPVADDVADFRGGFRLTYQVARVLAGCGYPDIMSFYPGAEADFERLQAVLTGFVHSDLGADRVPPPSGVHMLTLAAAVSTGLHDPPAPTMPAAAELVEVRLIGTAEAAERAAQVLALVFDLVHVSDPHPARDGRTRIYLTGAPR